MNALKVRVENGRIKLDEPTDLPEGTELYLVPADGGDELDDEERAALHTSIEEAERELDAGKVASEEELWAPATARLPVGFLFSELREIDGGAWARMRAAPAQPKQPRPGRRSFCSCLRSALWSNWARLTTFSIPRSFSDAAVVHAH
jgi:hypothetical protein